MMFFVRVNPVWIFVKAFKNYSLQTGNTTITKTFEILGQRISFPINISRPRNKNKVTGPITNNSKENTSFEPAYETESEANKQELAEEGQMKVIEVDHMAVRIIAVESNPMKVVVPVVVCDDDVKYNEIPNEVSSTNLILKSLIFSNFDGRYLASS